MPWHEKNDTTPFEAAPPNGLFFLDGDLLARRYQQEWIKGKKYPVVTYPSGLQRELWNSSDEGGIINVFGAFELLRQGTREEGFQSAGEFAAEYGYTIGKRGNNELLVFHPYSGHGYAVRYDNGAQQIVDVKRFPAHAMELLNAESRAVLPDLYSNEQLGLDAVAPVKFFAPGTGWTWYATEYDGENTFFGLVAGFEVELGYFLVTELEGVRGAFGLPIERDLDWRPTRLREIQALHR